MQAVKLLALSLLGASACVAVGSGEQQIVTQGEDGGASAHIEEPEPIVEDDGSDEPSTDPFDGDDGGGTGFEECAVQTTVAETIPLDMVIMLDRSGSMDEAGKWSSVTGAIDSFASDADSAGIGVGLSYFPQPYSNQCQPCTSGCELCFNDCCAYSTGEWCFSDNDCDKGGVCYGFQCHAGGGNATCDVGKYAQPDVPIGVLPGVAPMLNTSMAYNSPKGGTPTGPALNGAVSYATNWAAQHPNNEVVLVLATDGEPTECQPQGIGDVASIAASALNSSSIPTFVIGVGSNLGNLNTIASAGGTQQAYLVDGNANAAQQFLDALNEIRKTLIACDFQLPDVEAIDYDLVNVQFTPGGQASQALPYVGDEAGCAGGGWYYDNPSAPTTIVMCDATCNALQSFESAELEIVYGCETIVK